MSIQTILDGIHTRVIRSVWLQRFTVFNRVVLAAAFAPSGIKKILGERFTQVPITEPVGFFFEAMYRTGFYYNFLGWMQVIAAILLLIPRTSTLGAVLFFPIVINICLITISMRFGGTWAITSMMVLANLYLLCWDYDKLKFILPFAQKSAEKVADGRWLIIERVIWGVFGGIGFSLMMAINPFVHIPFGILWSLAVLLGGAAFSTYAIWHRKKLPAVIS
jgi:uncharacterized membrane protein YphA (DoxX/SURF4 family)